MKERGGGYLQWCWTSSSSAIENNCETEYTGLNKGCSSGCCWNQWWSIVFGGGNWYRQWCCIVKVKTPFFGESPESRDKWDISHNRKKMGKDNVKIVMIWWQHQAFAATNGWLCRKYILWSIYFIRTTNVVAINVATNRV